MKLSDKAYQEFKEISDKKGIKYESDAEMRAAADNLIGLMGLLYDKAVIEEKRKARLEKEPEGFPLEADKTYNCLLCKRSFSGDQLW